MPYALQTPLAVTALGESAAFVPPIRSPAYVAYTAVDYGRGAVFGADTNPAWASPLISSGLGVEARRSFFDWYFRIHFVPAQFALGNLVGRQQRQLVLWNANFTPAILQSLNLLNGEGITISQPIAPPAAVGPLETLRYLTEIDIEGPPVINAAAIFVVDGVTYTIPFTGRRVVVFPFKPNWASAVEETLQHLTVVATTYTGKEQVSELRVEPRRILEYNIRLNGADANLFDSLVYGWVGRLFALPLWPEKSALRADVLAGGRVLTMPTVGRTIQPGAVAVVFRDSRTYETVEVESVVGDTVTLLRPLEFSWPAKTPVYPVMVSAADPSISTVRQTDTHLDARVRFTASPVDNFPRALVATPPAAYRGDELYLGETNWIAALRVELTARENRSEGTGEGIFKLVRRAPFPLIQRGFQWLLRDKSKAELIRQFVARRRGRLKPVWMPSGFRDFELAEPANSAQSTIFVRNSEYASLVDRQLARRDIVILMRNGSHIARRINGAGVDPRGFGSLTLDANLGQNIDAANVKKISFLGLYRLTSDEVTFSWQTDKTAIVQTNLTLKEPIL